MEGEFVGNGKGGGGDLVSSCFFVHRSWGTSEGMEEGRKKIGKGGGQGRWYERGMRVDEVWSF